MRIGLIADTHIPTVGRELPAEVFKAFEGVDLILHAGDIVIPRVLDSLETIAPTMAVRGNEDHRLIEDPRFREPFVFNADGLSIGLTHHPVFENRVDFVFKDRVDVVVYGHTHEPESYVDNGILFVNPGSATSPYNLVRLGTVGILEIENGKADFKVIQL